jgi:hypothetical protein
MPNKTVRVAADASREELAGLIENFGPSFPPAFEQALKQFLVAVDYNDSALIRSHFNTAYESLRDAVHEEIGKRLGSPQATRAMLRNVMKMLIGEPSEEFDALGKEIVSGIEKLLNGLIELRDGMVKLVQDHGYEVANASRLERDIEELRSLRKEVIESWRGSDLPPPPVDRKMVEESRAAIARGEGEDIKDLIARLESSAAGSGV